MYVFTFVYQIINAVNGITWNPDPPNLPFTFSLSSFLIMAGTFNQGKGDGLQETESSHPHPEFPSCAGSVLSQASLVWGMKNQRRTATVPKSIPADFPVVQRLSF